MNKTFYITTTLPYVNAKPHIGHAVEYVRADVLARYKKEGGYDVFFNTGSDEHGQKIYDGAVSEGISPQKYVDRNSENLKLLLSALGISSDIHFIRTTDDKHVFAAQELWRRVRNNGYIYKKKYKTKYCVGCELEKTDSELVDGRCSDHPNLEIKLIDEENYFFKFSAFQTRLMDLYESIDFVVPDFRQREIENFVKSGLKDFSISRLSSKMPWGVPVPDDPDQVMYVWFDALTSYISTLGWPTDMDTFNKYWKDGNPTQYCGQDNLRQQSAMWQAMLMAADLPNSRRIIINGFVTGEGGIKMSKTIGNVVDPILLIQYYGTDSLRYFLLRHIHPWEGSSITYDSFYQAYNSHLVNGLGNLVSRLLTMSEKYLDKVMVKSSDFPKEYIEAMENFRYDLSCDCIWDHVAKIDKEISETEPYKLIKSEPEKAKKLLHEYIMRLNLIGRMLRPIMPTTSDIILSSIHNNKKPDIMFERKPMASF